MQFTKRRKIYILVGMFVLLAVTGYLNFALNNNVSNVGGDITQQDIFLMYRQTRASERDADKAILQSIANSTSGYTDEAKTQAAAQLMAMMQTITFEDTCEALILRDFSDAIVTRADNGNVNVLVKNATQLEDFQVANILKIVKDNFIGQFDVEQVFVSILD